MLLKMKRYLLAASLLFIILEQPGVTSFAVSRCAFRGHKTNVEISKRMSLMIRSPFTHSVITSTITRHMSLDNDEFMASLSGDLTEASNRNIDPRMEQDPGNKSTQSRMFQRLMQAKQDGIPGMPPAPRQSPADQQQQQQQQIMNSQAAAPASANPYYPPQDTANTNPFNNPYAAAYPPPQQQQYPPPTYYPPTGTAAESVPPPSYYPPPPFGYPGYYPPPQPTEDGSVSQVPPPGYFPPPPYGYPGYYPPPPGFLESGASQVVPPPGFFPPPPPYGYPGFFPPQPMPEGGVLQVPPPAYYPPPSFGYPGSYPPPPQQAAQPQQQFPQQQQASQQQQQQQQQQQPQLPIGAPPLPPISELIGTNTGGPPRAVVANPTDSSTPEHVKKRQPDKISNASDLYLETLKLDTATRKRARERGDLEEANAVFRDPRINQLKESLRPYLESSARLAAQETSKLVSTNDEEMMILAQQQRLYQQRLAQEEDDRNDPSNAGISYREMLKRRLSNKNQSITNKEDA